MRRRFLERKTDGVRRLRLVNRHIQSVRYANGTYWRFCVLDASAYTRKEVSMVSLSLLQEVGKDTISNEELGRVYLVGTRSISVFVAVITFRGTSHRRLNTK